MSLDPDHVLFQLRVLQYELSSPEELALVVGGAVALALAGVAAVRRAPPPPGWQLVPGLCCGLAVASWAIRTSRHPERDLPLTPAVFAACATVGWAWTSAMVTSALAARPDAEARASYGRFALELVVVALACAPAALADHDLPLPGWVLALIAPALLGSIRASPSLCAHRRHAALTQLACTLGVAAHLGVQSYQQHLEGRGGDPWYDIAIACLPVFGLALAGLTTSGLPSVRHVAAILAVPAVGGGAALLAVVAADVSPELRVGDAIRDLPVVRDQGHQFPAGACLASPDRVPCPAQAEVVWVGPADRPLPVALADPSGPWDLSIGVVDGGELAVMGLSVLGELGEHWRGGVMSLNHDWAERPGGTIAGVPVERDGTGFRVGGRPAGPLVAATRAAEQATARCAERIRHRTHPSGVLLAAEDGWTARELATMCADVRCWFLPRDRFAPVGECAVPLDDTP